MITMFYICERGTRRVIPDVYAGRGGTAAEPVEPDTSKKSTTPRLFHSHLAARTFLTVWAAGKRVRTKQGKKLKPFYSTIEQDRDLDRMEIKAVEIAL